MARPCALLRPWQGLATAAVQLAVQACSGCALLCTCAFKHNGGDLSFYMHIACAWQHVILLG